jgi:hypothetical protein
MSWTPDPPPGSPPPGWQPSSPPPGYGYGGYQQSPEHPQGTTIILLGVLGLVLCQVLGPFAWSMGTKALREIDASGIPYSNRGTIQAGRICGMIATGLLVVSLLFFVVMMVAVVFLGTSADSEFNEVGDSIVGLLAPFGR